MMNELVVPDLLAGRSINADQAVAIEAVAGPMPAIIIVGRRTHWQVNVAKLLVGAHRRPDIGVASFLPGFLLPSLDAGFALLCNGVKGPEQTSGDDVEASDIAGRRRPVSPPVHHRRTHH